MYCNIIFFMSKKRKINAVEYFTKESSKKSKSKSKDSSIIYFLILCHGEVNYTKNTMNEFKPVYIKIPPNISVFNKITFAPLGINNMMHDEDNEIIFEKIN